MVPIPANQWQIEHFSVFVFCFLPAFSVRDCQKNCRGVAFYFVLITVLAPLYFELK